jgi:hypothetical protein
MKRTLWLKSVATLAAVGLLWGNAALAVNNYSKTKIEQRKVAQAKLEKIKAEAQAKALKELEKHQTALEKEWGIKILGLRLTAAGYVLDFRYKVLDPKKAAPIVQRQFSPTPYVLVERSGAKLGVPFTDKAGSLRSSVTTAAQIKRGRNYTALFANPSKHVKPGEQVTVVFGEFKAEHVTVQ